MSWGGFGSQSQPWKDHYWKQLRSIGGAPKSILSLDPTAPNTSQDGIYTSKTNQNRRWLVPHHLAQRLSRPSWGSYWSPSLWRVLEPQLPWKSNQRLFYSKQTNIGLPTSLRWTTVLLMLSNKVWRLLAKATCWVWDLEAPTNKHPTCDGCFIHAHLSKQNHLTKLKVKMHYNGMHTEINLNPPTHCEAVARRGVLRLLCLCFCFGFVFVFFSSAEFWTLCWTTPPPSPPLVIFAVFFCLVPLPFPFRRFPFHLSPSLATSSRGGSSLALVRLATSPTVLRLAQPSLALIRLNDTKPNTSVELELKGMAWMLLMP